MITFGSDGTRGCSTMGFGVLLPEVLIFTVDSRRFHWEFKTLMRARDALYASNVFQNNSPE